MSNKTCKDCLHCFIENKNEVYCVDMPWHYPFGGSDSTTLDKEACEHFVERDKPTIFDHITQSYEMLAEKLVYKAAIEGRETVYDLRGRGVGVRSCIDYVWKSSVTGDDIYASEEEAFSATVAKLKEVSNG